MFGKKWVFWKKIILKEEWDSPFKMEKVINQHF